MITQVLQGFSGLALGGMISFHGNSGWIFCCFACNDDLWPVWPSSWQSRHRSWFCCSPYGALNLSTWNILGNLVQILGGLPVGGPVMVAIRTAARLFLGWSTFASHIKPQKNDLHLLELKQRLGESNPKRQGAHGSAPQCDKTLNFVPDFIGTDSRNMVT